MREAFAQGLEVAKWAVGWDEGLSPPTNVTRTVTKGAGPVRKTRTPVPAQFDDAELPHIGEPEHAAIIIQAPAILSPAIPLTLSHGSTHEAPGVTRLASIRGDPVEGQAEMPLPETRAPSILEVEDRRIMGAYPDSSNKSSPARDLRHASPTIPPVENREPLQPRRDGRPLNVINKNVHRAESTNLSAYFTGNDSPVPPGTGESAGIPTEQTDSEIGRTNSSETRFEEGPYVRVKKRLAAYNRSEITKHALFDGRRVTPFSKDLDLEDLNRRTERKVINLDSPSASRSNIGRERAHEKINKGVVRPPSIGSNKSKAERKEERRSKKEESRTNHEKVKDLFSWFYQSAIPEHGLPKDHIPERKDPIIERKDPSLKNKNPSSDRTFKDHSSEDSRSENSYHSVSTETISDNYRRIPVADK